MSFAESYVPTAPRVTVNGVQYEISYGEGWSMERCPWGEVERAPVYVWRSVDEPTYTAPSHVSQACDAANALADEVRTAERAAGWPSP